MGVESDPSRGRGRAGSLLHVRSIRDGASRAAHGRPRAGKAAPAQHGDKNPKNEHREPRQRERKPAGLEDDVPLPATPGLQIPSHAKSG